MDDAQGFSKLVLECGSCIVQIAVGKSHNDGFVFIDVDFPTARFVRTETAGTAVVTLSITYQPPNLSNVGVLAIIMVELIVGDQASSYLDLRRILWHQLKRLMIVSYNFNGGIIMLKKLAATDMIGALALLAPASSATSEGF